MTILGFLFNYELYNTIEIVVFNFSCYKLINQRKIKKLVSIKNNYIFNLLFNNLYINLNYVHNKNVLIIFNSFFSV